MAEFTTVIKEKERMCEHLAGIIECAHSYSKCQLSLCNNGQYIACSEFISKYPQQAEEIIMTWAKENPIITNAHKFKEVYGIYPTRESCPFFAHCDNAECNTECEFGNFWLEEYKEPKGE